MSYATGDLIIVRDRDLGRVYVRRVPAAWRRVTCRVLGWLSIALYLSLLPMLAVGVFVEWLIDRIGGER